MRRDDNEQVIVTTLEAFGARVQRLDGKGLPDLLVRFGGVLFLLEVKKTNEKLTADQVRWWGLWGIEPVIVRSPAEALGAIGAQR